MAIPGAIAGGVEVAVQPPQCVGRFPIQALGQGLQARRRVTRPTGLAPGKQGLAGTTGIIGGAGLARALEGGAGIGPGPGVWLVLSRGGLTMAAALPPPEQEGDQPEKAEAGGEPGPVAGGEGPGRRGLMDGGHHLCLACLG